MDKKVFINLKKPIDTKSQVLDKLRINVDYQKGGINYFSGNINEGGVYVYITPCTHEIGVTGFAVTGTVITGNQHKDSYKILLKELGRKSQKQIDLAADKVLPYAQQIADLYSDGKHQDVFKLIKSINF